MNLDFTKMDFEEIKDALKTSLRTDGVITDFDYEGSNTDTLLNILAYVSTLMNHNLNYVSNEAFLQTAENRKNILKHAKSMGYRVERKTSANIKTQFRFGLLPGRKLVIPKYTGFYTTDKTQFINKEELIFTNNTSEYKYYNEEVLLTEGIIVDYKQDEALNFTYSAEYDDLLLKYKDIENEGIEVIVNDSYITEDIFHESTNLVYDLQNENKVFQADFDPETEYVRIKFLRTYGIIPNEGDDIKVFLIISKGAKGNNYKTIQNKVLEDKSTNSSDTSTNQIDISVVVTEPSYGGSDEETSEHIKTYAPVFNSTGGRAITSSDWEAILANIPTISYPSVWGGEELGDDITNTTLSSSEIDAIKKPGFVYMTGVPSSGGYYFDTSLIEDIKTEISKYSIMALRKIFVQPVLIDAEMVVDVVKNISYKYLQDEIYSDIETILNNTFLNPFGLTFNYSKVLNEVYNIDGVDSVTLENSKFSLNLSKENFYYDIENYIDVSLPYTGTQKNEVNITKITSTNPELWRFDLVDIPSGLSTSPYDYDINVDTFLDHIGIQSLYYQTWDSAKTYSVGEKVFYDDGSGNEIYEAIVINTNETPTDGVIWKYIEQTSNYMDRWQYPIDFSNYKRVVIQLQDVPVWNTTTEYVYGDYVTYNEEYFKCLETNTNGDLTDTAVWEKLDINPEYVALGEFIVGTYMVRENNIKFNTKTPIYIPSDTQPTTWDSGTTYSKGDLVEYSGLYYVSRVDSNLNIQPDTDVESWTQYSYNYIYNKDLFNTTKGFYFDDLSGSFDFSYLTFKRESMVTSKTKTINFL